MPPIEATSRQHGLKTARKWSNPSVTPPLAEGERQLARVVADGLERIRLRFSVHNEFARLAPKALPDKTTESAQVFTGLKCKTAGRGVRVSCSVWPVAADRRSNERLIENEEVSEMLTKPAIVEAAKRSFSRPGVIRIPSSRYLSIELCWRADCKPLSAVASNRQYLLDIVITVVIWRATRHPMRARTGCVPVLEPDIPLTSLCHLKGLSNLDLDVLTVVAQGLFTLKEIRQMEREMCLHSRSRSKESVWRIHKPPNWAAIRRIITELPISSSPDKGLAFHCPAACGSV
jgi:hypothetical protein